jgi:hypothetical protein
MAAATDFTIIDESAYTGAMFAAILFAAARNSSACHLAFATRMGAFSVSHHFTPYESRNYLTGKRTEQRACQNSVRFRNISQVVHSTHEIV